ncbi:MAG: BTAD domain-containing putative transcriptional regulator [Caldilineaceae bacterium]
MLYLNLFGTPEIYLDNPPALRFRTRKAQALLIYLAVTARGWSRDALATLFWPETDDQTARKNLRDILPPLRRQLDDYLLLDGDEIGLTTLKPHFCDVTTFSQVLEQPLKAIDTPQLAETLAHYRGEFLDGWATSRISADFELWALRERERLLQLALVGFTTLCRRQQEAGVYEAALTTNRQLLKLAPWDEATHRQQMLLLAQSGQQTAALAHFATCRQILDDELGVEPDAETLALYAAIQAGSFHALPEQSAPVVSASLFAAPKRTTICTPVIPHNLISPLAAFIGRQAQMALIQTQLLSTPDCRLLTIIGPGGMGKSALALAVGQQLLRAAEDAFADGIFWVPLADISAADPAEAPPMLADSEVVGEAILRAIAEALNTQAEMQLSSIRQLQTFLRTRQLLLILDNFEHLLSGTHALVRLLTQAPQVKALVTSRTRLGVRGESILALDKLSLPAQPPESLAQALQSHLPAAAVQGLLQESEAVAMFVQRAQQLDPSFCVNGETIGPLVQICRLVEGLPLGIELATSMLPLLSCHELVQGIAENLDFLESDTRDLPQGQRTLQAVFERSWRLLSPEEQQLLARLAIFPGSFHRDAATAIAGATFALLKRLVDQSLVNKIGENRYTLHRTVRAFAEQKLLQGPEQISILQVNYARFYLNFLATMESGLFGATYGDAVEQINADLDNLQMAWRQAVAHQLYRELEAACDVLFWFYDQQGFYLDMVSLYDYTFNAFLPIFAEQTEQAASDLSPLIGRLYTYRGVSYLRMGQLNQALTAYETGWSILQAENSAAAASQCLIIWGKTIAGHDTPRSKTLLDEALRLLPKIDSIWLKALIYQVVGEFNFLCGNYAEAETQVVAGYQLAVQGKWVRGLVSGQKALGRIALTQGRYHQAKEYIQQSIALAQQHQLKLFHLESMTTLGELFTLQGKFAEAQVCFAAGRTLAEEFGIQGFIAPILWEEGRLAEQRGDYARAKAHFTQSLQIGLPNWWVTHALPTLGWALIGLGELAEAQAYFQATLADAQSKGRTPVYMEAQAGLTYLTILQAESEQASATQYPATITRAVTNLQQICQHSAATQQTRDRIDQLIAKIAIAQ